MDNVDNIELEKFSSQAAHWWDIEGPFKTLHHINPVRLDFVNRNIELKNHTVLDIGCGGGILAEAMAESGAKVTGIDASSENIQAAQDHAANKKLNLEYVVNHAEIYAKDHIDQYDLITCMELLEHVPDPISLIEASARMVKPGGHIIFSTLNRNLKSYLFAVLAGEYLLNILPKGTHQYERFIRPSELVKWCRKHGLEMNDLAGIHYNPLSAHCMLSKNTDINYLLDTKAQ